MGQTLRVLLAIWIVPISRRFPPEKGMHPLQDVLQAHGGTFICCFANQRSGIFLLSEHGGLINIKECKAQELFWSKLQKSFCRGKRKKEKRKVCHSPEFWFR